ncbi:MAG TPA: helix-turn-helix domain-containing protein [Mycobacteriales bacterium]|nr:helix-turn-helix domain-containing protein [Mycobacteriales bacterium]
MTATTIPLFDDPPAPRQRRSGRPLTESEVLLTAAEAADVLKIGRSKLYELMARGAINSVKLGRCRRFRRSDLDRFIRGLDADPAD